MLMLLASTPAAFLVPQLPHPGLQVHHASVLMCVSQLLLLHLLHRVLRLAKGLLQLQQVRRPAAG
jgi:hypothetical protein